MLLTQLSSSHSSNMVGHAALGGLCGKSHIPPPSLHGGKGYSFPGLVPPNGTVITKLSVGIKPGDCGVIIGYQVDEFTHNWSVECFVA